MSEAPRVARTLGASDTHGLRLEHVSEDQLELVADDAPAVVGVRSVRDEEEPRLRSVDRRSDEVRARRVSGGRERARAPLPELRVVEDVV